MKKNTVFGVLVVVIIGITIFNFATSGESSEEYVSRIEQERENKDRYMLGGNSPLLEADKASFSGLKYFPISEEFKVRARVVPVARKQPVFIATTTGEQKKYIPFGYAEFELKGKPQRLLIYQDWEEKDPSRLSLMFADETSSRSTYGGGRYIDLKKESGQAITIDFNMAYNPYCHFNVDFSCPIPPVENLMEVAIEAGEKLYKEL